MAAPTPQQVDEILAAAERGANAVRFVDAIKMQAVELDGEKYRIVISTEGGTN